MTEPKMSRSHHRGGREKKPRSGQEPGNRKVLMVRGGKPTVVLCKPVEEVTELEGMTKLDPQAAVIRPGRNEPCPCGSGAKYKRCCGHRDG